ncbi:HEPN domain-containing protein [Candidatus Poribacteria bacterium]|nr:HEPN domain-containing protein [Candidatus Poribacteria bacterium]MYH83512.1 HEPN domain-containing protein [Candidatus Poribacteria bacterium]MYK94686.1 HEPN domain-containing protein [Candidatus Poribacteria bacterium]
MVLDFMNRNLHTGISELAEASRQRLADATALLNASRWRGAMYMAGYAVECLLKTKLMHIYNCQNLHALEDLLRQRSILPAHRTIFTHQLEDLLRLTPGHNRLRRNRNLWHMFQAVNLWTPQWRYTAKQATRQEATRFLTFIENVRHWIDTNL